MRVFLEQDIAARLFHQNSGLAPDIQSRRVGRDGPDRFPDLVRVLRHQRLRRFAPLDIHDHGRCLLRQGPERKQAYEQSSKQSRQQTFATFHVS